MAGVPPNNALDMNDSRLAVLRHVPRLAIALFFTGLYAFEAVWAFLASAHGRPWWLPAGALFALVASLHIWFVAWPRVDPKPLSSVVGIGLLMAVVPPVVLMASA
jgi:hypothetical protein